MSSFAHNYQHQCLLEISRRHREVVDPSRVHDGKVIGQDNWDNLAVSCLPFCGSSGSSSTRNGGRSG